MPNRRAAEIIRHLNEYRLENLKRLLACECGELHVITVHSAACHVTREIGECTCQPAIMRTGARA